MLKIQSCHKNQFLYVYTFFKVYSECGEWNGQKNK